MTLTTHINATYINSVAVNPTDEWSSCQHGQSRLSVFSRSHACDRGRDFFARFLRTGGRRTECNYFIFNVGVRR